MKFVYEEDSRAIVMRGTGNPKIEGDTVALIAVGYEWIGPIAAILMNASPGMAGPYSPPLPPLDLTKIVKSLV